MLGLNNGGHIISIRVAMNEEQCYKVRLGEAVVQNRLNITTIAVYIIVLILYNISDLQ